MNSNLREASTVTVVRVVTYEGAGIPEDPGRLVTSYYSLDGELLAKHDPNFPA